MSTAPYASGVVVIDSGSTDKTLKYIEDALKRIRELGKFVYFKQIKLPEQSTWSMLHGKSPHPSRDLGEVRNLMRDYSPTEWIWTVDADEVYTKESALAVVELPYTPNCPPNIECVYLPIAWSGKNPAFEAVRSQPGTYGWTGRLFRNNINYVHANFDLSVKYHVVFPGEAAHYYMADGHWRVPIPGQTKNCLRTAPKNMVPIYHYEMATKPWRRRAVRERPFPHGRPKIFDERRKLFGSSLFTAHEQRLIKTVPV
jgi:glycosyltransferase involved in cell wall biosynthesis